MANAAATWSSARSSLTVKGAVTGCRDCCRWQAALQNSGCTSVTGRRFCGPVLALAPPVRAFEVMNFTTRRSSGNAPPTHCFRRLARQMKISARTVCGEDPSSDHSSISSIARTRSSTQVDLPDSARVRPATGTTRPVSNTEQGFLARISIFRAATLGSQVALGWIKRWVFGITGGRLLRQMTSAAA